VSVGRLLPALLDHLLDRITDRNFPVINSSTSWLARYRARSSGGQWFKWFPEMIVCGERQSWERSSGWGRFLRAKRWS